MVGVENLFGEGQVVLDLGLLVPRNADQPIQIVPHDGRFRGHRAHLFQLLDFGRSALACFLGQLRLLDLVFEFGDLVAAVLAVAKLLLNGLHLLIQIVLALGLLHLPLDAGTDALFHLQDGDFALHHAQDALKPLGDGNDARISCFPES